MKYNPYSPSRLDVATCGYSFINEYGQAERIKRESIASARGTAAHEVLERISKEIVNGRQSFSQEEVREWIIQAVTRHPAAYAEIDEIFKIANLYVNRPINFTWKDVRTEQNLAVTTNSLWSGTWDECAYDDPKAIVRGRIDLTMISEDGNSAIIYDHKTQFNVETADIFQMGVYAWIVWKIYPFLQNISTVLHFARWGMYSQMYTWNIEDLKAIENEMLSRIEVIERRTTWEATPHKNCNYCHFIAKCPAMADFITVDESGNFRVLMDNLEILGDTSKAVKLAGIKRIIDEWSNKIEHKLKAHVEFAGPIAIPGVIYEYRAEEKIDYDYATKKQLDEYVEICRAHDENPLKYMSLNATSSKTVWRCGKEQFVGALSKLFKRKTSTTFKGWKA
jgi:hypothetical protein